MTMNKTYRWVRLVLVLLPFAYLLCAFFVRYEGFTPSSENIRYLTTTLTSEVWQTFSFNGFARFFGDILDVAIPSFGNVGDYVKYPTWLPNAFSWYTMVFFIDAVYNIITFLPRFVISRFGGGDLV